MRLQERRAKLVRTVCSYRHFYRYTVPIICLSCCLHIRAKYALLGSAIYYAVEDEGGAVKLKQRDLELAVPRVRIVLRRNALRPT
jgi:hypothetical protein